VADHRPPHHTWVPGDAVVGHLQDVGLVDGERDAGLLPPQGELDELPCGQRDALELLEAAGGRVPPGQLGPHRRVAADAEAPVRHRRVQGDRRVEGVAVGDGGAVTALPQGHDAWVIGDEAVVTVDWCGASDYAKG
jgi:hypothetical protein